MAIYQYSKPFFSIIIPIYNVSRFLDSGIQYVLNQSFEAYEVILVDDGSTDGSGELCDQLAKQHPNVRCYHQPNQGSGPARNLGIKEAKGEYIVFFDIDDRIDDCLLQVCSDELVDDGYPELLVFSYDSYDVKYKTIHSSVFEPIKCDSNYEVRDIYVDHLLGLNLLNGFVWNKVYSRDFLLNNNICFPRLLIQQDEVFNLRVYRHVHRTLISPQVLYHYYVYDKGNTRSRFISDRFEIYNAVKDEFLDLYKEWSLHDERMLKYVYNRFFSSIVIALNSLLSTDLWVKHRNENRLRMASILCCEETIDCISNMLSLNIIPKSFIQHLYFKAIKRNNLFFYRVVFILDHFVQSIKWEVRKRL